MRFSIITCTYNPEPVIFDRVLDALANLIKDRADAEVILVDNNSAPPLSVNKKLTTLLTSYRSMRLIAEGRQGQTHARIAGAKASRGEVLIFVDDDNLLPADYLDQLGYLLEEHPRVGVWGPAVIRVEFPEGAPGWINKDFRHIFQERYRTDTRFGAENQWTTYYPVGSGMAIKRHVFEKYAEAFLSGRITAGGRSGNSLLCGEDAQMVWTSVKSGWPAGTSPALSLVHLIASRKANLDYMSNLQFNIAYSYVHALTEMFPEKKKEIKPLSLAGKIKLWIKTLADSRFRPVLFYRRYKVESAWFRGVAKWRQLQ